MAAHSVAKGIADIDGVMTSDAATRPRATRCEPRSARNISELN